MNRIRDSNHIVIASPLVHIELVQKITKRTCCAQNGVLTGEAQDWAYSKPALVVHEIIPNSEEQYPVIRGEDIDGVTVAKHLLEGQVESRFDILTEG